MKVLVTGGSGFLGINLIRFLRTQGVEEIRVLDIAPFEYPEASEPRLKFTLGDVRDVAAVERVTEGCDVVVHCAAALPLYSKADIISTEVDGCRNVLNAARKFKLDRMIQISSTAVYGVPEKHPIYETDPLIGVGPYGQAKIDAENLCREAIKEGFCVSIIRPKSFVGPERLGVFALFYDWAYTGHGFPMIGSGKNRYQLMDVDDLDHAIWNAMTYPKDKVATEFNIGAKEFTTMKEDYQVVLDKAGYGKHIVGMPVKPLIAILRILEFFHLSPLYPWVYATASKDSFVSIEKAEKLLDYKPRYSNQAALLRNYEWYVAHIKDFAGKSGVSHRVPWKQGMLALAKLFF